MLLVLVARKLGLGTDGYGYLLAAQGAGGIVGAAIAGRIASRAPRPAVQVIALGMVAAPLPLLAITGSLAVALILGVIAGAGALIAEVVADTGLQLTIDDERLGSAYGFVFAASVSIAADGCRKAASRSSAVVVDRQLQAGVGHDLGDQHARARDDPEISATARLPVILEVIAGAGALIAEVVADTGLQLTIDDERLGSAYGFVFAASVGRDAADGYPRTRSRMPIEHSSSIVSCRPVSATTSAISAPAPAMTPRISATARLRSPAAKRLRPSPVRSPARRSR